MVSPGCRSPVRSAASIIVTAMRSLIEPPGFCDSSFRNSSERPVSKFVSCTSGVFPIRCRVWGLMRATDSIGARESAVQSLVGDEATLGCLVLGIVAAFLLHQVELDSTHFLGSG